MILSAHQPHYLPWLGYFAKIRSSDLFVYLDNVQYKHREYQNRNRIKTEKGPQWLTVPVITKGLRDQFLKDVRIDNERDWQKKHWRAMQVSYGRSEYFREYAPFFEEVYTGMKWKTLADLNVYITGYLLSSFGIETPVRRESEIGTSSQSTERMIELCRKTGAGTYLSGSGGREYLKQERFDEEGIELVYQDFVHPAYRQTCSTAKDDFVPAMAAIDLLFNEGPAAGDFLKAD